ncbi:MAG: cytochrome c3 family protein [Chakrabartia sp.]
MTFIVHHVSFTKDGREIIRSKDYDQSTLSVGRSPGSDIALTDVAVPLDHARITAEVDGSLTITAIGGAPFTANGRSVTTISLGRGDGGVLNFGSHEFNISRSGEDISIKIERKAAVADSSEAKDSKKVFSLGNVGGKMRLPAWALVVTIIATLLVWPIWTWSSFHMAKTRGGSVHADQSWSPGPISLAHASFANDCQACHVNAFESVRDSSCVACHKDMPEHADAHGLSAAKGSPNPFRSVLNATSRMFNRPENSCVDCHLEHEGAVSSPPTPQRFCTDCHDGLSTRVTTTKLLDVGDFATKHPEFRPGIVTNAGDPPVIKRISLSANPKENTGLKFPHAMHLSSTNGVARMATTLPAYKKGGTFGLTCNDCHTPSADKSTFEAVDMEKNCSSCHSLGLGKVGNTVLTLRHGDARQTIAEIKALYRGANAQSLPSNGFLAGRHVPGAARPSPKAATAIPNADAAIRRVFSQVGTCYECHQVVAPANPASLDFTVKPVSVPKFYMSKAWFDHKAHDTAKCETCHKAPKSKSSADVLMPGIKTCQSCHAGATPQHDKIQSTCSMCHGYHFEDALKTKVGTSSVKADASSKTDFRKPS